MKTKTNVGKIQALKPTAALLRSRKGMGPLILVLALAGLSVLGYGAAKGFGWIGGDNALSAVTVNTPGGEKTVVVENNPSELTLGCSGVQSVNALYNDLNFYKLGTDPNNTLTIIQKDGGKEFVKAVADDATTTTVPVMSSFKGLAGNSAGTPISGYFAEEIEFSTECADVEIQPRLRPAGEPTITVVNDNGITANSDSNHESADASSTYTPCVTVKAPAESCAARYGAVVAFEYRGVNVTKIDSSDLESTSHGFLYAHQTNHSASEEDMDQYKVMMWNGNIGQGEGMLCDGKKVEFCFDVTTSSATPGEDGANVKIHWYPINKDIDADEYTIITGIYDEDNNVIARANNTATYYTA